MSERMSMEQVRDSLASCVYALAYQGEMEADQGGGSVAAEPIDAALQSTVDAYGRLTTADDAVGLHRAALQRARRAVHGD